MLFNTFQFAYFFAILFPTYWALRRYHKAQNLLLLLAGYYFYACWEPKFLALLILSTVMDFACGLAVDRIEAPRKRKAVRDPEHGPEPGDARLLQVRATSSPRRSRSPWPGRG